MFWLLSHPFLPNLIVYWILGGAGWVLIPVGSLKRHEEEGRWELADTFQVTDADRISFKLWKRGRNTFSPRQGRVGSRGHILTSACPSDRPLPHGPPQLSSLCRILPMHVTWLQWQTLMRSYPAPYVCELPRGLISTSQLPHPQGKGWGSCTVSQDTAG